jgi:hypothetical protein
LLLLATKLFSATFFQLFAPLTGPTLPTRRSARRPSGSNVLCLR